MLSIGSTGSPTRSSAARISRSLLAASFLANFLPVLAHAQSDALAPFTVVADAVPDPLTGANGDAARGRAIVADRQVGLCLLCHSGPFPQERFQGNLAPDLAGAGLRWSEGQLRLRIIDASRFNPDTIMPPYYRVDDLTHVAAPFRNRPILGAEQIEDVVAFLVSLRD
jgi:sulfur-oxidizing protein SoxX